MPRDRLIQSSPESSSAAVVVQSEDGTWREVPEGEFRSGAGRLLFIRRGACIEIRCPRSKELFRVTFRPDPPAGVD